MEVKSAADLLSDSTFLAFCERWKEEGRAPFPLSDYLRDWDLWEQAEVADWAHRYKERPSWNMPTRSQDPTPRKYGDSFQWFVYPTECRTMQADDLWGVDKEGTAYKRTLDLVDYLTFPEAIAALLDHYRPVSRPEEDSGGKE